MLSSALLLVAALLCGPATAFPHQPADPVIGIVTHPLDACVAPPTGTTKANACVESFYSRWLEAAGARVVAIPHNATWEVQQWWLQRVNGVLFQGGDPGPKQLLRFFETATNIYNYALQRKAQGDPFVVWGTCFGFQILSAAAAGNLSVIQGPYPGMDPAMLPVNFTLDQPSSRLLGDATCPPSVRETMLTKPSTLNWHSFIIQTSLWSEFSGLSAEATLLTTNLVPGQSVEFASAWEALEAEVYAVQFHPERPPYEFSNDIIGHTAGDIGVSEYLARFLVSRLRLNQHAFDTPQQAEANRLSRFPLVDLGWGHRSYYVWDSNDAPPSS